MHKIIKILGIQNITILTDCPVFVRTVLYKSVKLYTVLTLIYPDPNTRKFINQCPFSHTQQLFYDIRENDFNENMLVSKLKIWYLSAIEIIDTQVARQGRQYHRNPKNNTYNYH